MDAATLIETFELFDDWEERYRYLIDLGRKLPPMPEADKNEVTKVRGCVSQVWMTSSIEAGPPPTLHFVADSDAHIVKGLVAILLALYSGRTAEEILATDIKDIFGQLGLEQHLSPNRRNGFFSMVERIHRTAQADQA